MERNPSEDSFTLAGLNITHKLVPLVFFQNFAIDYFVRNR